MVHLNLFHSLLLYLIFILPLEAGVVAFFDPNEAVASSKNIQFNVSDFTASEPISLDGMFNDWHGDYHPSNNKNIAVQDMRIDLGTKLDDHNYLGYFYKYNVYIETQKDFTDFFYRIKNDLELDPKRVYALNLHIKGIKQSGLVLAHSAVIFNNSKHSIKVGGAFSLTFGHDMQEGTINGEAKSPSSKSYEASGEVSSYYTHNYLYDLNVKKATAYGYGSDFSIEYKNKTDNVKAKFLINDLVSRMYWKNLPYSHVNINTSNEFFDNDGYAHYNPSISGKEIYSDFIQTIEPRYKLEIQKSMKQELDFIVGTDMVYDTIFPYIMVNKSLSKLEAISLSYENKFKSFGIDYRNNFLSIGIKSDGIKDNSTLGLHINLLYDF